MSDLDQATTDRLVEAVESQRAGCARLVHFMDAGRAALATENPDLLETIAEETDHLLADLRSIRPSVGEIETRLDRHQGPRVQRVRAILADSSRAARQVVAGAAGLIKRLEGRRDGAVQELAALASDVVQAYPHLSPGAGHPVLLDIRG